jgi:acyl transferase domain-containing protein/NADPH:quinone reductase-like Zn-dependent oxidoreductase/SAM-dependent methyltransferase
MDPNQRGLMETAYHALENAGIPSAKISGTNTSVHVGFFSTDYMTFGLRDPLCVPRYYATGSSSSILANRISWHFNLHGPSVTIDTACSSSLIAMDLACQGMWAGTSDTAIVGGANLILSPELNIALCNMNFLSPDGKCFSFDHRASGYARGEGFSVLVLKPLSKALAAGDTIRALVRSIGSNQDGYTSGGITQPSQEMQTQLVRETYARAGLDMGLTRYFEAHGTGTLVGDPTEARAVGESFREFRTDDEPLYVGAVKSNIGHLEGVSGLAGVVKTVLALEKGVIPPNTNFEKLNPNIDDRFYRLCFPQKSIPWPTDGVRRASVNSFGFGGTNAHVVLDDVVSFLNQFHAYENTLQEPMDSNENEIQSFVNCPKLVILSSSDETGISRQIKSNEEYLKELDTATLSQTLSSYSFTLGTRRTLLQWRSFGIIDSTDLSLANVMSSPIRYPGENQKLGFIFTGQGAQWQGMGKELLSEPVFADSLQQSQAYLMALGCSWAVTDLLSDHVHTECIDDPQFSQILTTCIQVAIVDLFAWLSLKPSVVVGHSSGEIAAAYAAGHISHAGAIKVSYFRGILASRLVQQSLETHSMAAIGLSRSETAAEIAALGRANGRAIQAGSLTISCINSPSNTTVSGPISSLQSLVDQVTSKRIFARVLKVGVGYHSPQMSIISQEYTTLLDDLDCSSMDTRSTSVRPIMVSSVTGTAVSAHEVCNGQYWARNMVSPVDFLGAMQYCVPPTSHQSKRRLDSIDSKSISVHGWVELGPHAALRGPMREILQASSREGDPIYTSALVRDKSALVSVIAAAGQLFCHSIQVDICRVVQLGLSPVQRRSLRVLPGIPAYQFSREDYHWEESQANQSIRFRKHGNHDLLGTIIGEPNPMESSWKFILKEEEMPWVIDHKVDGAVVYPAAGMIVMAIEAMKQLLEDRPPFAFVLSNVEFPAAIVLSDSPDGVDVRIHLSAVGKSAKGDTDYRFRIFTHETDKIAEMVCSGTIRGDYKKTSTDVTSTEHTRTHGPNLRAELNHASATCTSMMSSKKLYQIMQEKTSIEYGPDFQVLDHIYYHCSGKAVASLLPRHEDSTTSHTVHPSRLDGIFQLGFAAIHASREIVTMVPTFVSTLWIPSSGFGHSQQPPQKVLSVARDTSGRNVTFDIKAFDGSDGELSVQVSGLELTSIAQVGEAITSLTNAPYLSSHVRWNVDLTTLDDKEIAKFGEATRPAQAEPIDYFKNMETLIFQYGARALLEVDRRGGYIIPGMEKYENWLRLHIGSNHSGPLMSDTQLQDLCSQVKHTALGEIHIRIGQNLDEFLRGDADPLEVIFADEALIANFYLELTELTTSISPLCRYLDSLVHKDPTLSILEVGAGTGSLTTVVLNTIANPDNGPRFKDYIFTDISAAFLEKAKTRFSQHTKLSYRILNVETDLNSQGFEQGVYDVVIADNVLHATHDLRHTMDNVRALLRPGGKLILKELSTPSRMLTGFVFGLSPGWWLSKEPEREISPLLTPPRWDNILQDSGFSGIDAEFADSFTPECHVWTIFVSTATTKVNPHESMKTRAQKSPIFVLDLHSPLQREFALDIFHELSFISEPQLSDLAEASKIVTSEPNVHTIFLMNELEGSLLSDICETAFGQIQKVLTQAKTIIWIKRGANEDSYSSPDYGLSDGLIRVARHEIGNQIISVCIETANSSSVNNISRVYHLAMQERDGKSLRLDHEYQEIEGKLCVNRLTRATSLDKHVFKRTAGVVLPQRIAEQKLEVRIRTPGLLDTIFFRENVAFRNPLASDEVDVEVRAVGISYRDCLTLLGKFDDDVLSIECSGVVRAVGRHVTHVNVGQRVAVCADDMLKTYIRVPKASVHRIPDIMSFPEAASFLVAFVTAYYCLVKVARLSCGETVLIHTAAGGTGQAMVQLAQYLGAVIYATVGSSDKSKLLTSQYGIPRERIFNSRDDSFAQGVMRATGGQGVDVIVNSQQGRLLEASWNCIAICGRFLDIGLKDAYQKGQLPMEVFTRNVVYAGINIPRVIKRQKELTREMVGTLLGLFEQKTLRMVHPLHTYPLESLEDAFRLLQSGKSCGKIVLEVNKQAEVPVLQGSDSDFDFSHDATYVIAGAFGGLGRSIVRWFVRRGARHLLLLSRSGSGEKAQELLAELRNTGVNYHFAACDIADVSSLRVVLRECRDVMPLIRGCIQATMVLKVGQHLGRCILCIILTKTGFEFVCNVTRTMDSSHPPKGTRIMEPSSSVAFWNGLLRPSFLQRGYNRQSWASKLLRGKYIRGCLCTIQKL